MNMNKRNLHNFEFYRLCVCVCALITSSSATVYEPLIVEAHQGQGQTDSNARIMGGNIQQRMCETASARKMLVDKIKKS